MKTNTSKDFSTEDLKRLLNKLYKQFNKLSESTMNPLLTGMFLLGVACTFFPVSTVGYLAMVFGASSGLAYAVAKKQTNLQFPDSRNLWVQPWPVFPAKFNTTWNFHEKFKVLY